jgi:hypothetical protein
MIALKSRSRYGARLIGSAGPGVSNVGSTLVLSPPDLHLFAEVSPKLALSESGERR